MANSPSPTLQAISGVTDTSLIRVVLFINNELVHVPLNALLEETTARIADLEAAVLDLEARVLDLETP